MMRLRQNQEDLPRQTLGVFHLRKRKRCSSSFNHCRNLPKDHTFLYQVDDWSIPAPTDDWSAPPKGELSISPQPKDDWCLSSPKEILNKDDWCLSSPKEILNSPVDEWSLPPVVPKEVADKGGDKKVSVNTLFINSFDRVVHNCYSGARKASYCYFGDN